MLSAELKTKYNAEVKLTNISMGGNASYAGYVRTKTLHDGVDYDLVVLCYGQNDRLPDFGLYYESMIRAEQNKYPHASVICILESSQKHYTEQLQIIQALTDHYGLPVADTIAPFKDNYSNLEVVPYHPIESNMINQDNM